MRVCGTGYEVEVERRMLHKPHAGLVGPNGQPISTMGPENAKRGASRGAGIIGARTVNKYVIEVRDKRGRLVARRECHNMLTTAGANKLLDATIKTGLASPAWYVGLIKGGSAPTFAIGDTMGSHAGWTEIAGSDVTQANRQAFTPGAISAGSVDNTGSVAVYTGNATFTLQGLFVVDNNTLAGSTGTLYGEAAFTAAAIQAGYTINVTATLSITAG